MTSAGKQPGNDSQPPMAGLPSRQSVLIRFMRIFYVSQVVVCCSYEAKGVVRFAAGVIVNPIGRLNLHRDQPGLMDKIVQ